jgi:hypothetical protein
MAGQAVMGDLGIDDNEARSAFDALTCSVADEPSRDRPQAYTDEAV